MNHVVLDTHLDESTSANVNTIDRVTKNTVSDQKIVKDV